MLSGTPEKGCTPVISSSGSGFSSLGRELGPGCTPTTLIFGFFDFKNPPAPEIVPPVPTQATRISTLPSVSSQISGPVVTLWMFGFAGLEHWSTKTMLSSLLRTSSFSAAIAATKSPFVSLRTRPSVGSSVSLIVFPPNA